MRPVSRGLVPLLFGLVPALPLAAATPPGLAHLRLEHEGIDVYYAAAQASTPKTPPAWLKQLDEAGVYGSAPLVLDLGAGVGRATLVCDSGPSADPSCYLLRDAENPDARLFEAPGTRFEFRADGTILTGGHSDNLYDQRRLYRYDGARYAEVAQPLRYVGVEAKAKAPIALRMAPGDGGTTTLTLPAGSAFTILLNDNARVDDNGQNPDYLVRTADGVVGWAHLPSHPDGSTDAEGLFYAGD